MKISEKWLRSFVEINRPMEEIASILTLRGLECEKITSVAAKLNNIVVAEIIKAEKHPSADRLRVCQVNDGAEILTVVCGAPNAREGIKVALAKIGAELPQVTIKKSKIRGVESCGMLCSVGELGLAQQSEGIMELPGAAPVGKSLVEYLALDDAILEVSITPNRGDCASVFGLAREIAAIEGAKLLEGHHYKEHHSSWKDYIPNACSLYLTVKIIHLNSTAETPFWMKERLRSSGLSSINAPVDVTNYVMLECGQPLHAFDAQKISGDISVRFARPHETLALINGNTITLDKEALIIADAQGPVALAGIMGGKRTAISATTTDIIMEGAHFIPANIARTARHFNISSDSAYRFERGVDPQLPQAALNRAADLIMAIAGGDKLDEKSVLTHAGLVTSEKVPCPKIRLRYSKLEKVLGVKINAEEIKKYFAALNLTFEETTEGLAVTPPSYRFDLHIEEDLIEEILRMHGCDAVVEIAPQPSLSLPGNLSSSNADAEIFILKTRGYHEIISYSFVDEKLQTQLWPEVAALKLKNPISPDMSVMRTTLWTGLITTLMYNLHRQQTRVRLVEVGLCFANNEQTKKIAGLSYGAIEPESWKNSQEISCFYDVKSDVFALLTENYSENDYAFQRTTHPALHPLQSARLIHRKSGQVLGEMGVLHPKLVQELKLLHAPVLFELAVNRLKESQRRPAFLPLSKFPEVRRDLSLLVPENIPAADITRCILDANQGKINTVTIFDVYQDKGVPEGTKSVAISLIIQEFSKTLTDEEVATLMQKVIDLVRKQFNATLRD